MKIGEYEKEFMAHESQNFVQFYLLNRHQILN